MARYLINTKTGLVLDFTEVLWKERDGLNLVECDEKGNVMKPAQPDIADRGIFDPMSAIDILEKNGVFKEFDIEVSPLREFVKTIGMHDPNPVLEVKKDLVPEVVEAIKRMKSGEFRNLGLNDRLWTSLGIPWLESLEKESGFQIPAKLRNKAWEEYQKLEVI